MHFLSATIALTVCGHVTALAPLQPSVAPVLGIGGPALPMKAFDTAKFARPLAHGCCARRQRLRNYDP